MTIKHKHKQEGFSPVEIILIIVIVGLLGGLGWVTYSHFAKKTESSKPAQATTSKTDSGHLTISAYGIHIPQSTDTTYSIAESAPYTVSDPEVRTACSAAGGSNTGVIGMIYRYQKDEKSDGSDAIPAGTTSDDYHKTVTVGQYIYVFSSVQNACADPSTTEGRDANDVQAKSFTRFSDLFLQLSQT